MAKGDFRLRKSLWDRFHDKFVPDPNSGCWLWTGAAKELGYGVIGLGHRGDGTAKAHRVAYQLYKGDIPQGMNVLHSCDLPCCVNPAHLRLGTLSDNSQDCVARGRHKIPDNRGERATWAKLNVEKVEQIKKREMAGTAYARLYGVSKSTIYQIWSGRNWSTV
jgi:hypothetical protein